MTPHPRDHLTEASPRAHPAGGRAAPPGLRERAVAGVRQEFSFLSPGSAPRRLRELTAAQGLSPAAAQLVARRLRAGADYHAPPLVEPLRTLRLGAPEPYSEPGHQRWFPHGVLLRRLITDWLEQFLVTAFGGVPVATAALLRWGSPGAALVELAGSFSERIYDVAQAGDAERLMLRYGGDPGFFALLRDAPLPDEQLPLRCYELVDGFRRSRSGELRGIQRTRSFTFFDCHCVCAGTAAGVQEYLRVLSAQIELLEQLPGSHVPQVTLEAGDAEALTAIRGWVDATGQAVVLESTSRRRHYYRLLHNIYDERGLRTLHGQLDEVNGRRWRPADERHLAIVHSATGSLERWLLVFLLDALDADPPELPMWLAPVHVRVLPVGTADLGQAERLAEILSRRRVRVEIDDRDRSVARRVREAERQWVPFVVVLGSKEAPDPDGRVPVRLRGGELVPMSAAQIATHVEDKTGGLPFRRLGEHRLTRMAGFT